MHLSFCFVRNAYKSKIYFSLAMHLNKNYAPKIGFYIICWILDELKKLLHFVFVSTLLYNLILMLKHNCKVEFRKRKYNQNLVSVQCVCVYAVVCNSSTYKLLPNENYFRILIFFIIYVLLFFKNIILFIIKLSFYTSWFDIKHF